MVSGRANARAMTGAPVGAPCRWVAAFFACVAMGFAPGSGSAVPADGEMTALLGVARGALDAAGESAGAKTVGAELWLVRRRVATTTQLMSMAVQAEQGDEACLCGRTSASTPEVERQARLLAEAALLFHMAGDRESAVRNLARLRNVAHKAGGDVIVWQLLVRMSMLLDGAEAGLREAGTMEVGKGDVGKGQASEGGHAGGASDATAVRVFVLAVAGDSRGIMLDTRRMVLREAWREWRATAGGAAGGQGAAAGNAVAMEKVAVVLAGALARAEMSEELAVLVKESGSAGVRRVAQAATRPVVRAAASDGVSAVVALARGSARAGEVAGRIDGITDELAAYQAAMIGAESVSQGVSTGRLAEVGRAIRSPLLRGAFATGALRTLTADREAAKYDDMVFTRPYLR